MTEKKSIDSLLEDNDIYLVKNKIAAGDCFGVREIGDDILVLPLPCNCEYETLHERSRVLYWGKDDKNFGPLEECGGKFTAEDAAVFVLQCKLFEPDILPADWLHYGTALAWMRKYEEAEAVLEKAIEKAGEASDAEAAIVVKVARRNCALVQKAIGPIPLQLSRRSIKKIRNALPEIKAENVDKVHYLSE